METSEKKRRRAYRRFVERGISKVDDKFLEILERAEWGIGDDDFQERIRDLHAEMAGHVKRPEDVSFRHSVRKVSPDAVLDTVADLFEMKSDDLRKRRYECVARAVAAKMLGKHAGMNQRDIGVLLNMGTGSAVCRQLKRLRDHRAHDSDLGVRIKAIESALGMVGGHPGRHEMSIIKG